MYQVLPRTYIESFDVFPGDKSIKKWMLDLASQAVTYVQKCIEEKIKVDDIEKGIQIQYWTTLKEKPDTTKEILPSTCRNAETIFTSMAVIGGRIFSNHQKNVNHGHKESKDLVSVKINPGGI